MFVAVEGLSCTGKTTLVRNLVERSGFKWIRLTPKLGPAKDIFDRLTDLDARYLMYLSAGIHSSVRIGELVAAGEKVVVDGYFFRTIAYHVGMGASVDYDFAPHFLAPDATVLLVCDETRRQERRVARNREKDHWDLLAEENLVSIIEGYSRFGLPMLDTTNLNEEAVYHKYVSDYDLGI